MWVVRYRLQDQVTEKFWIPFVGSVLSSHLSLSHVLPLLPQFLLGKPVPMPDQVEAKRSVDMAQRTKAANNHLRAFETDSCLTSSSIRIRTQPPLVAWLPPMKPGHRVIQASESRSQKPRGSKCYFKPQSLGQFFR